MLRFSANENVIRKALSQSLPFPVPLDKGNRGSGNEIEDTPKFQNGLDFWVKCCLG